QRFINPNVLFAVPAVTIYTLLLVPQRSKPRSGAQTASRSSYRDISLPQLPPYLRALQLITTAPLLVACP
ncbi:hypothetical protein DOTSEDRAFT_72815, partial [Dothistroma septosporum NZE10]